jgi:S-adenosylmethionine decarboxylase proenzyme
MVSARQRREGEVSLTLPDRLAKLRRMVPWGAHLLLDFCECRIAVLDDAAVLERALTAAAHAIGARVIGAAFHRFVPHGVTGFLLLEESHISIHTWPERAYAAVDVYTCGEGKPEHAAALLREALGAGRVERLDVARGRLDGEKVLFAFERR